MRLGKEGDGQEEGKLKPDAGRRCSPVREQKVGAPELCLLGRDGEPSSVASLVRLPQPGRPGPVHALGRSPPPFPSRSRRFEIT
jgi:hypothetical protein